MRDFKVISYFTPNYGKLAKNLIRSLKKFKISYDIEEIDGDTNWTLNTYFKPYFIKKKLNKHKCNLVWLDVDCELVQYPRYFDIIEEDLGIFVRRRSRLWGEVVSGGIFLRNSPRIKRLVDDWIYFEEEDKDRKQLEQYHLGQAVLENYYHKNCITVFFFPDSYFVIDKIIKTRNPVICHSQASRKFR